jgi:hypothetical protein
MMHWAYVAGFVDGEGTITFARTKSGAGNIMLKPRLIVGQKTSEVLYGLQEKFRGGHVFQQPGGLFVYQYDGIRNLPPMLEQMLPFLIVKKRQAEILIDYAKCRVPLFGSGKGLDQHCFDLDIEMRRINLRTGHASEQLKQFNADKRGV